MKKELNYLQAFQAEHGLKADNKLGKITFNKMADVFDMNKVELAYFLGQLAHETAKFTLGVENLNYSEKGLIRYFRKYFLHNGLPIVSTSKNYRYLYQEYAKRPKLIANRVYGGRMGNTKPNDGWYYRGRFSIQLTGHDNYFKFQEWIDSYMECPDYILDDLDTFVNKYYWIAGIFHFDVNEIFTKMNAVKKVNGISLTESKIIEVTKLVNGGKNGLKERIKLTKKYLRYV